jgi:hypothetical protein
MTCIFDTAWQRIKLGYKCERTAYLLLAYYYFSQEYEADETVQCWDGSNPNTLGVASFFCKRKFL